MLIGYVLVMVINGAAIEPVSDEIMTFENCQVRVTLESVYHPDNEYGCGEVIRGVQWESK